ncbi:hypothetical protein [Tateyamaria sp. SN3-11]|uniref:hypothetical protein n=1 Tax=Tateyamaria sp. SN3-11 TaxID=3092147 RepID=UPI0039E8B8AF
MRRLLEEGTEQSKQYFRQGKLETMDARSLALLVSTIRYLANFGPLSSVQLSRILNVSHDGTLRILKVFQNFGYVRERYSDQKFELTKTLVTSFQREQADPFCVREVDAILSTVATSKAVSLIVWNRQTTSKFQIFDCVDTPEVRALKTRSSALAFKIRSVLTDIPLDDAPLFKLPFDMFRHVSNAFVYRTRRVGVEASVPCRRKGDVLYCKVVLPGDRAQDFAFVFWVPADNAAAQSRFRSLCACFSAARSQNALATLQDLNHLLGDLWPRE